MESSPIIIRQVRRRHRDRLSRVKLLVGALAIVVAVAGAAATVIQNRDAPGKSIGTVSTRGELIVLTLDAGALGQTNFFDLSRRTLRFRPDGTGYRVEPVAFTWDPEFGAPAPPRAPVSLHEFEFPFSGRTWNTLN